MKVPNLPFYQKQIYDIEETAFLQLLGKESSPEIPVTPASVPICVLGIPALSMPLREECM